MANILVTPEELQSTSAQLNAGASEIQAILSKLRTQVSQLQSTWKGNAQAQFQVLWAEWEQSSAGIQHALTGISRLTAQAALTYDDTEQAITRSFAR